MRFKLVCALVILAGLSLVSAPKVGRASECARLPSSTVQEAREALKAVGVFWADYSTPLSGESHITRAQMAVLIVQSLNRESDARILSESEPFSDMEGHWSSSFVALLKAEGIIKGVPDGRFLPDKDATLAEVELALARTLRLPGYPTLETAALVLRKGGVETPEACDPSAPITREQAIVLFYRVLSVPMYSRFGSR